MFRRSLWFSVATILSVILGVGCGGSGDSSESAQDQSVQQEFGSLTFYANGEDFVRQGFLSKDGWQLTFNHVFITVTDISAYQTDPPYDPHSDEPIQGDVETVMDGVYTIDLAQGDGDAGPIPIETMGNVPTGHYNAMSWRMIPADYGPSKGYSIYIDAQAEKGDQSYNVRLGFQQSYQYRAGEYVGDQRKGFVLPGETGELEMTFHMDHLFGDGSLPEDDELNVTALGFGPFAALMQEGTVEEDLSTLSRKLSEDDYQRLLSILTTLGHTGEGHCHCTVIQ